MASPTQSMIVNLSNLRKIMKDGEAWRAAVLGGRKKLDRTHRLNSNGNSVFFLRKCEVFSTVAASLYLPSSSIRRAPVPPRSVLVIPHF